MRAYLLRKTGDPGVLQIEEIPEPQPREGEVRVRLQTIGLNYAEVLSRKGLYGWAPKRPYVPGMEGFGEIDAVGPGVMDRRPGEKVIVGAQTGCYAEKVCVPAHQALPALKDLSPEENAAFAVNFMTAWVALRKMARLLPQDSVLISPAAGGVGTAAVQLALARGCRVYGCAGSEEKLALIRQLGAHGAVNYRQAGFAAELRSMRDGAGFDVIIEMVGGRIYRQCLQLLEPFGRIVVVGFASLDLKKWNPLSWWRTWRDLPRADIRKMAEGSYGVLSSHVGYLLPAVERMQATWRELVEFVQQHELRPVVGRVFNFDEMPQAHEWIESRRSTGKVVVRVTAQEAAE